MLHFCNVRVTTDVVADLLAVHLHSLFVSVGPGFMLHGITPFVQPLADCITLLYNWYFCASSNGLWQLYDICELIGRDFHVVRTWQGVKEDREGVPVYYRLIGSTPSRPPAVTVDKPYKAVWG